MKVKPRRTLPLGVFGLVLAFLCIAAPGGGGGGGFHGGGIHVPTSTFGRNRGGQGNPIAAGVVLGGFAGLVALLAAMQSRSRSRTYELVALCDNQGNLAGTLDSLIQQTDFNNPRERKQAFERVISRIGSNCVQGSVALISAQKKYDERIAGDAFERRMFELKLSRSASDSRLDTEAVVVGLVFTITDMGSPLTESRVELQTAMEKLHGLKTPSDLYLYYLPEPNQSLSRMQAQQVFSSIVG